MSRASGCLWLVVGLVLALAAGGVAFVTLQRATLARQAGPIQTGPVVVAAHAIAAGTLLTDADVATQDFPVEALPVGAVTSLADASGKVTTIALNTGEMLLAHHLTQPDISGANLGFTLSEGKIAVALAADDLLSSTALVQVGSHVDILYSLKVPSAAVQGSSEGVSAGGEKLQYTFGALQGAVVVAAIPANPAALTGGSGGGLMGGGSDSDAPKSLGAILAYILALEPQDALTLKYLRDADALMDLALRNAADDIEHEMQPVDLQYMIDKFQLQGP